MNEYDNWDHPVFHAIEEKLQEERAFIEQPLQLEEGVMECPSCHSFKTWSYQKQVRSADEGFTTFTLCAQCGAQWREN